MRVTVFYFSVFKNVAIFLVGVALSFILSGCATFNNNRDAWFGKDKFYHFVASGVVGASATTIAENSGVCKSEAEVIGISTAIGVGVGKEWYDKHLKGLSWSWKDMFWNLIGGTMGSLMISR